jgi:hypothetical protein
MNGFDLLGVEPLRKPTVSVGRTALAIAAGAVGAMLAPKHPVLAFLGTAALASNTHAVLKQERSFKDACKRMGRHLVASAGSLALPKYPAMGYIAGAVAGDLLIAGDGGGIIDEWTDYEGIRKTPPREDVIDAEIVSDNTKALVKR